MIGAWDYDAAADWDYDDDVAERESFDAHYESEWEADEAEAYDDSFWPG